MAREWSTEEADDVIDQIDNVYEGLECDDAEQRVTGELWAVDTSAGIECKAYVDTKMSVSQDEPSYPWYTACVRVSSTQSTAVSYSRSSESYTSRTEAITQARAGLAYVWRNRERLVDD